MNAILKSLLGLLLAFGFLIFFGVKHITKSSELSDNWHLEYGEVEEVIPIKEDTYGKFTVEINIDGESYPFLIDNAAGTYIDEVLIDRLQGKRERRVLSMNAVGGFALRRLARIPDFQLGNLMIRNVYAMTTNFQNTCGERIYYGIIGNDLLKDFRVHFDIDQMTMRLSNKMDTDGLEGIRIPFFQFSENDLNIKTQVEIPELKRPIYAIIDMGSNGFLTLTNGRLHKTQLPSSKIYGLSGKSFEDKGKENEGASYLLNSLKIGDDIQFDQVEIFTGGAVFNLLGCDFLKLFNFTLDYPNQELILKPRRSIKKPRNKTFGFNFNWSVEQQAVLVEYVFEGSAAYAAGIKVGDQVLDVDQYRFLEKNDYCSNSGWFKEDIIQVKIKDSDGQQIVKTLKKQLIEFNTNTKSIYSQNN